MRPIAPFKIAGTVAGLFFLMEFAWADVLPGPAMPETVSKSLTNRRVMPTNVAPPTVETEEKKPSPLGEQAKKIKFQLNGIILEGNRTYSEAELRPIYAKQLHKTISVADLFDIVQDITNYYRNNGYILTRAILPPQHVKGGVVKVQIIEGYIGKVTVSGDPKGATPIVQAFGNNIRKCRPLQIARMEKYLLLANEVPGTDVKAVLSPSKTEVGAADLTLVTQNTPFQGYASYDNYGTRYIGPQQMTANVGFNSLINSGDTGQVTMTKTPKGGELTYIDANYGLPLNAEGVRMLIGATRAQTHPLFVLQPSEIDGVNSNYYTGVQYPLIRTRSKSLNLRGSFNYQDSVVTTLNQPLYADHLRSVGVGVTYNFADSYLGSNMLSGDFRQGLPLFGYTSNTNPDTAETSRPGGRGDYTKIMASASRLQVIYGPFSAYGVANGQWAFNPLLASEQFTFGGSQIGRGYDVAELIGDKGLDGSIELRYDWVVQKFLISSLQPYLFYDIGGVWNFKNIGGVPTQQSGTSFGIGSRFYMTKYVSGNLMWTQTLTKEVAAEELIGQGRNSRVFFSIIAAIN